MKKILVLMAVLLLAAAVSVQAQVIFSEDWETGTDGWVQYQDTLEPHPALDNTQNTTPGGAWSLRTADNAGTNYTNALDHDFAYGTMPSDWVVEFSFMDTGATRDYLQLQSYDETGGLVQLISFGVYNAVDTSVYNYRVAFGSVNWANTTVARTNDVWHQMKIVNDATGLIEFFIDGASVGSATTTNDYPISKIRTGSGLTNAGHGVYFDDIVVSQVPEPSSLVALATGLLGLGGLIRRRRA